MSDLVDTCRKLDARFRQVQHTSKWNRVMTASKAESQARLQEIDNKRRRFGGCCNPNLTSSLVESVRCGACGWAEVSDWLSRSDDCRLYFSCKECRSPLHSPVVCKEVVVLSEGINFCSNRCKLIHEEDMVIRELAQPRPSARKRAPTTPWTTREVIDVAEKAGVKM